MYTSVQMFISELHNRTLAWCKLFRVVNLPTVPGDVLAGAAAIAWTTHTSASHAITAACAAGIAIYCFGLADNDIVGVKYDGPERPIPAGSISLGTAKLARAICLLTAAALGIAGHLSAIWWGAATLLVILIAIYNRTKWTLVMGGCRGMNVLCGGAALMAGSRNDISCHAIASLAATAVVWTLYIAIVTKYSEGEEDDPSKRQFVGFLIGALVYLQLGALLLFYLLTPCLMLRNLLLAGAAMLILLRLLKRLCSKVSAS